MFDAITFSEFGRLLGALGFHETRVKGSHIVFRHEPTDNLFLFPIGTKRVRGQRIESVRRLVTGRGVTTTGHFDALFDSVWGEKV